MSEKCFIAAYYYRDKTQLMMASRTCWANSEEEAVGMLVTKDAHPPEDPKGVLFTEITEKMAKRVLGENKDPLLSLAEDAINEN